jgi:hypothetical protein
MKTSKPLITSLLLLPACLCNADGTFSPSGNTISGSTSVTGPFYFTNGGNISLSDSYGSSAYLAPGGLGAYQTSSYGNDTWTNGSNLGSQYFSMFSEYYNPSFSASASLQMDSTYGIYSSYYSSSGDGAGYNLSPFGNTSYTYGPNDSSWSNFGSYGIAIEKSASGHFTSTYISPSDDPTLPGLGFYAEHYTYAPSQIFSEYPTYTFYTRNRLTSQAEQKTPGVIIGGEDNQITLMNPGSNTTPSSAGIVLNPVIGSATLKQIDLGNGAKISRN